jgi:hypothetical protein
MGHESQALRPKWEFLVKLRAKASAGNTEVCGFSIPEAPKKVSLCL